MIGKVSSLWSLMTIFFTDTFISDPFFLGLLMFVLVFVTIFIFMKFFDGSFIKW